MKSLLFLLSIALAGGTFTPPVSCSADTSETPYITVETESLKVNKIIFNSPGVDATAEKAALELWELYPGWNVIQFGAHENRTIIGFDAPQLKSITRLTLNITFNIFHSTDVFNWFPKTVDYTFNLKVSDRYGPHAFAYLQPFVSGAENLASYNENFTIPYVGTYADIKSFETDCASAHIIDSSKKPVGWPYIIDNPNPGTNYWSIDNSNLKQKQFYVIMPVAFDIQRVWISVAGIDINDDEVDDGLDSSGLPFTKDYDGEIVKYIELGADDARSVYFTHRSTIVSIAVLGALGGQESELILRFGDYDFHSNLFITLVKEYQISDLGEYINSILDRFAIEPAYDAVLSAAPDDGVTIQICYLSDGFAVYQNIVGEDGVENPVDITPDTTSDYDDWLYNLLGGNAWDQLVKYFGIAIGGLMLVAAVVGVSLLISSSRQKKAVAAAKRNKKHH